jgi:hypothetical protein
MHNTQHVVNVLHHLHQGREPRVAAVFTNATPTSNCRGQRTHMCMLHVPLARHDRDIQPDRLHWSPMLTLCTPPLPNFPALADPRRLCCALAFTLLECKSCRVGSQEWPTTCQGPLNLSHWTPCRQPSPRHCPHCSISPQPLIVLCLNMIQGSLFVGGDRASVGLGLHCCICCSVNSTGAIH